MKISQDVRDYAAKIGTDDVSVALKKGLEEQAEHFKESGGQIYQ
jgi:phosphomethylpyrimidine synthase